MKRTLFTTGWIIFITSDFMVINRAEHRQINSIAVIA